jgi:hypothetical protein
MVRASPKKFPFQMTNEAAVWSFLVALKCPDGPQELEAQGAVYSILHGGGKRRFRCPILGGGG